jgi:DNA-binding NarL/FixJ family response regulator
MEPARNRHQKIRIIIAEKQCIVLNSLVALIESFGDFEIIGKASDGEELLRSLELSKPDLILLDVQKPGLSCIDVARAIDAKMPWVKVISLSSHNHPLFIKEMLKHGTRGFLSKNCTVEELREGMLRVFDGKTYFCSACSRVIVHDYAFNSETGACDIRTITPREIELISHLAEGYSTREIAPRMFISEKTVERHKSNLLKKMKLRNTAQLVKVAVENGLLIL